MSKPKVPVTEICNATQSAPEANAALGMSMRYQPGMFAAEISRQPPEAHAALADESATSVIAVGAASPCRYHVAVTEPAATPVSRELSTLLRSNNASLMPVESATMSP